MHIPPDVLNLYCELNPNDAFAVKENPGMAGVGPVMVVDGKGMDLGRWAGMMGG